MGTRLDVGESEELREFASTPVPIPRLEDERYLSYVTRLWHTCSFCRTVRRTSFDNLLHQSRCRDRSECKRP
ncbi:hypothetical protein [Amycolatopsis magusensis]|uniref:Uncharacterized protein n=1 Tax=Amycolatopsis magusensis TaxID=882444 RepID=A0ABS4PTU7_9PSEU|nr:hypothetical protein [Amycolatopsis magusensis]MBP2182862.1 hypothetical protein [Amycolatopsis magusensis]